MKIEVLRGNLDDPEHRSAILALTRAYALDPMGGSADLPSAVEERLIEGLRRHPTTVVFLATADGAPVAIATCFVGFSTFGAAPLLNVHDLHVERAFRRQGIGRRLLAEVEREARALGCCKLTLEVNERNEPARKLYAEFGFGEGRFDEGAATVLFKQKRL